MPRSSRQKRQVQVCNLRPQLSSSMFYLSLQGTFWLTFIVLFYFSFISSQSHEIHSFIQALAPAVTATQITLVISTEQACQPGPCPWSPPPGSVRSWQVWEQDGTRRLPPSLLCPRSFPRPPCPPPPPSSREWYVQDQSSGKVTPGSSRPGEM